MIAGILSAAIVFSTLSPAVNATEYVADVQEIVEEAVEELEVQEQPIEEAAEELEVQEQPAEEAADETEVQEQPAEEAADETEVQELPVEETAEEVIVQKIFVEEIVEEKTVQEFLSAGTIEENRTVKSEGTYGENLTWVLYEDGELVIEGAGEITDYTSSISEYPWYNYRSSIKKILFSDGITHVGIDAFYNCSKLEKVYIPQSVKSIGEDAFYNCSQLKNVIFDGTWKEWEAIKTASDTSIGIKELYLFVNYRFQYSTNEDGTITG